MNSPADPSASPPRLRLPDWVRNRGGTEDGLLHLKADLRGKRLVTVCEEARCPNIRECFSRPTATFMILGDTCTRACGFCDIAHGKPGQPNPHEPDNVAAAVAEMRLRFVVITSVARDDLPDEGAGHFAEVVRAIKERNPEVGVEVLTPDFHAREECIGQVVAAGADVYNHNIETVGRLQRLVRSAARYERSLKTLELALALGAPLTKSGLMLGHGETRGEVIQTLRDLRSAGCGALTMGQYLQPNRRALPVKEYIRPEVFDELAEEARALGFSHVFSGPLVRSSYLADLLHEQRAAVPPGK
ncbi:MAG: Lipoyl synthase [Myxococcota bacterium]|nr:Lipoyl synthase [Myxococcota bacterium]